ncbi:serpin family protein [Embleya sp. NPDC008237]|uniref:serpin family protein n=1 Tax=Embleya sp. NPDC008237 TaxID=3363978 RepID=UPI0036ED0B0C
MGETVLATYAAMIRRLTERWLPAVVADAAVERKGGDFVCSPVGLWLGLVVLATGARGETAAELRSLLGVAGEEAAPVATEAARSLAHTDALAIATGAWTRVPTYRAYRESLPDVGFGGLDPADVAEIDAWVCEATGGLIRTLPVTVDRDTLMILANALALKARWAVPFSWRNTMDRDFTDGTGRRHRVPTMHTSVPLADAWTVSGGSYAGSTVVELRCLAGAGGDPARVRLVLGAPGASAATVLPAAWAPEAGRTTIDADEVSMRVPRLCLRTRLDVVGHLAALRVRAAQTARADFSGASPEALRIDQVVQEAVLKIAEKGVEAAAVTASAAVAAGGMARPPRRVVHVAFDRPFGVVVLDGSGAVPLFTAWQSSVPEDVPAA